MTTHGKLRLLALRDQNDAAGEDMARQRERFADIRHIRHALTLLRPGGRIVALCYAGPRQRAAFENRNQWTLTDLEPGSFRSEGTDAAVAMITRRNAG